MSVILFLLKLFVAIFMFGLIIFVHELGHFMLAKFSGIQVNEFAIGMGPTLLKFQKGETTYALRAFPIGGFVAMEGEDEDSFNPRAFGNRPVVARILTVAAGAIMNLLLGLILLWSLTATSKLIPTTTVAKFDTAATSNATLQVGDTIHAINGRRIYISTDIDFELMRDKDGKVDLEITRDDQKMTLNAVPFAMAEDDNGNQFISRDFWVYGVEKTFFGVIKEGFLKTLSISRLVWVTLVDLITGNVPISQVAGPIGTIGVIGDAVSYGFSTIVYIIAMLSINIGVFNILPVPALDGGRLLFLFIELITRRRVPQKFEAAVHATGLVLLLGFMVFVSYSDITRLFAK